MDSSIQRKNDHVEQQPDKTQHDNPNRTIQLMSSAIGAPHRRPVNPWLGFLRHTVGEDSRLGSVATLRGDAILHSQPARLRVTGISNKDAAAGKPLRRATAYGWGNHAVQRYITDGNTGWDNIYNSPRGLAAATGREGRGPA